MTLDIKTLDFDKAGGLITAVVQDAVSGTVLMAGSQNREACERSLESGHVTFWSRTRQRLWVKGETSGNILNIVDIKADCDLDALLYLVRAPVATCHRQTFSCFGDEREFGFLSVLSELVEERKAERPENSYTTGLFDAGLDRIAQKVGEEAVELVIAAKNNNDDDFLNESADLLYHFLVLCAEKNISFSNVISTLSFRQQ